MPIQNRERRVGNHRVTRVYTHGSNLRLGPRADIQEEGVARVDLRSLRRGNDVSIADSGNGSDGPFRADDDPALVDKGLIEPSAEHLHGQEAVRRDAPDQAAKFIHVRVHHDPRTFRTLGGDDGSHAVEAQGRRIRLHVADHQLADRLFESRRARDIG